MIFEINLNSFPKMAVNFSKQCNFEFFRKKCLKPCSEMSLRAENVPNCPNSMS